LVKFWLLVNVLIVVFLTINSPDLQLEPALLVTLGNTL
jgi:hypothetical protein